MTSSELASRYFLLAISLLLCGYFGLGVYKLGMERSRPFAFFISGVFFLVIACFGKLIVDNVGAHAGPEQVKPESQEKAPTHSDPHETDLCFSVWLRVWQKDQPGAVSFRLRDTFGFSVVEFFDWGFDGTLDEVALTEKGKRKSIFRSDAENTESSAWGVWEQRYFNAREEASKERPNSEQARILLPLQ